MPPYETSLNSSLVSPPNYGAWNEALSHHFFNSAQRGRPVYLLADGEALDDVGQRLGIPPGKAEALFNYAIKIVVNESKANPFDLTASRTRTWRSRIDKAETPPPFVGLLAACVLAASKMAHDETQQITSANYYARLNAIVGLKKSGTPRGFEAFREYWRDLNTWLVEDNSGRLGLGTARQAGPLANVGWPLSQCLLRETDRRRLPAFFKFARISPGAQIDPADLLPALKAWCRHSSCRWPDRTKKHVLGNDGEVKMYIASVVASEAAHWLGEAEEQDGKTRAPIVLSLRLRREGRIAELQFFPRRPPGFPLGEFVSASAQIALESDGLENWYAPLRLSPYDVKQTLENGLQLTRGQHVVQWEPQPILVFSESDEDIGGFASREAIEFGESARVLCSSQHTSIVSRYLDQHAEPGWRHVEAIGIPSGWSLFVGVRVRQVLSNTDTINSVLWPLVPPVPISVSLKGGLQLERGIWLSGAEPSLHIAHESDATLDVAVDGQHVMSFDEPTATIDLRQRSLAPGDHQVLVGTRLRTFSSMSAEEYLRYRAFASEPLQIGHPLLRAGSRYLPATGAAVQIPPSAPCPGFPWISGPQIISCEPDLPEMLPEPVIVRGGKRCYYLLGPQPGMIKSFPDPGRAEDEFTVLKLPNARNISTSSFTESFVAYVEFPAVWLVSVALQGWRSIELVGVPLKPMPGAWPGGDAEAWKQHVADDYENSPRGQEALLWDSYRAAALSP